MTQYDLEYLKTLSQAELREIAERDTREIRKCLKVADRYLQLLEALAE